MELPLQFKMMIVAGTIAAASAIGLHHETRADLTIDRGLVACTTDSECEALEGDRVLIGLGCGPDKLTSYAREEDEFAFYQCDIIEARRVVGEWRT